LTSAATVSLRRKILLYGFSDDNNDGGGDDYDYIYGEWT
jgi:hypothetical protein